MSVFMSQNQAFADGGYEFLRGLDIERILGEFGSPLFLLSEELLRRRYRHLAAAMAKHHNVQPSIAYSFKTNYLPRICKVLKEEGALAEVVSGFEYSLAKKLGYKGPDIIFNGPFKTDEELKRALQDGCYLHIDNREELVRTASIAKLLGGKYKIGLRLNSSDAILVCGDGRRFGFNIENREAADACGFLRSFKNNLEVAGFHINMDTSIAEPAKYERAAEVIASFALKMKQEWGISLAYIDMGGGFGVKHVRPKAAQVWRVPPIDNFIDAFMRVIKKKLNPPPAVIIEPGRYLVSECMVLANSVVSVKYQPSGIQYAAVDGRSGIVMSTQSHAHARIWARTKKSSEQTIRTIIYGSSCSKADIIGCVVLSPVSEGDVIFIGDCGAYTISTSSQFIFPRPAVVSIASDGACEIVRRRENNADLTALDKF